MGGYIAKKKQEAYDFAAKVVDSRLPEQMREPAKQLAASTIGSMDPTGALGIGKSVVDTGAPAAPTEKTPTFGDEAVQWARHAEAMRNTRTNGILQTFITRSIGRPEPFSRLFAQGAAGTPTDVVYSPPPTTQPTTKATPQPSVAPQTPLPAPKLPPAVAPTPTVQTPAVQPSQVQSGATAAEILRRRKSLGLIGLPKGTEAIT